MNATPSELKRRFVVVGDDATVGEVWARVAALNLWAYVVVKLAPAGFAVFLLSELIETLKAAHPAFRPEVLWLSLKDVPQLLASRQVESIDEVELTSGKVQTLFQRVPGGRWVALSGGRVTGVLAEETRGASVSVDLEWLSPPAAWMDDDDRPSDRVGRPPVRVVLRDRITGAAPAARPGVLSAGPAPTSAAPPNPTEEIQETRYINAELEGRKPDQPLRVGETFTIAFDVDVERRKESIAADPTILDERIFSSGEDPVDLMVQLASQDFDVFTREPQTLRGPRRGKSKNKARFDLSPKHEGVGVLNAVFLKDGNFVQLMTLKLEVGKPLDQAVSSSSTLGRALDASLEMKPRDVTLVLTKTVDGYQAILSKAVSAIATLPITEPQLRSMIEQARKELLGVVNWTAGPAGTVYQSGIDIPAEVNARALRAVAKAGFRLFQQIFYGPAADAQSRLMGDKLRQMAQKEKLKIQILSQKFLLPWGILYMADSFDEDRDHVEPELFLGFKHIIEHIPLQPAMDVVANTIDSRPLLNVSVNVNADIDEQMEIPVIAQQLAYWKGFSGGAAKVVVRKTREEVKKALADASSPDQLLYFYCHAVSTSLPEEGGPDASAIVLTGNGRLTLADLNISAPTGKPLSGAPLVFVNACESAELSPLFYDGFVPYFMAKGARGVIGTECATPALFAAEWARRFFDRFLAGNPLGETFLDLRREFYQRHRNILGLLYALYCDADTQIAPAVAKSGG